MCSLVKHFVAVRRNCCKHGNFDFIIPVIAYIRRSSRCECENSFHCYNVSPLCHTYNADDEHRNRFPMCRFCWCRPCGEGHFLPGIQECKRIGLSRRRSNKRDRHRSEFLCMDHLESSTMLDWRRFKKNKLTDHSNRFSSFC